MVIVSLPAHYNCTAAQNSPCIRNCVGMYVWVRKRDPVIITTNTYMYFQCEELGGILLVTK